jgi:chemotaxis protein CheZ
MENYLKEKVSLIVNGKLTDNEVDEVINVFKNILENGISQGDENRPLGEDFFFKDLALEMGGSMKELAILIIEFRRDLQAKVDPEITDLTTKYIPQAADQLQGIIETTETAANKIMDNLDVMQEHAQIMQGTVNFAKAGRLIIPNGNEKVEETKIDKEVVKAVTPLLDYFDKTINNHMDIISELFVHMSFQDLTGQRIKRIMNLVSEMETKLKKMIVSFGIKVTEREKNPDVTIEELEEAIEEKVSELAGPQREGCGLDQAGIDDLLANI